MYGSTVRKSVIRKGPVMMQNFVSLLTSKRVIIRLPWKFTAGVTAVSFEDQDMFRLSGIHRDVYLVASPKVRLRDIHLTSQISDRLDKAELKVKTDVHNYGKKVQEATVRVSLLNTEGKPVSSFIIPTGKITGGQEKRL